MNNSQQVFAQVQRQLKQAMVQLPKLVGNEVVNFSKQNFNRQGFLNHTLEPWRKRKDNKKSRGRSILVQSGRLRRSIRIISANADTVTVGSDVPYAKIHNDGFNGQQAVGFHHRNKYSSKKTGTGKFTKKGVERMQTIKSISGKFEVKAHVRNMRMPKRRFLGASQYMMIRIKRTAAAHISKFIQ